MTFVFFFAPNKNGSHTRVFFLMLLGGGGKLKLPSPTACLKDPNLRPQLFATASFDHTCKVHGGLAGPLDGLVGIVGWFDLEILHS